MYDRLVTLEPTAEVTSWPPPSFCGILLFSAGELVMRQSQGDWERGRLGGVGTERGPEWRTCLSLWEEGTFVATEPGELPGKGSGVH